LAARAATGAAGCALARRGFARGQSHPTQGRATKVALLLSGVITDGGWSELAYGGLRELARTPGFQTAYMENITLARMQQVARGYSDDGFDLMIGHGFEFSSALIDVAPDYPAQKYFVTSYLPHEAVSANILFVDLEYYSAAFGAGALAALISEKKQVVGFVGGEDDPNQQRIRRCFIAGAQYVVPGIRGLGIITGDYDNAARGKEAAATLVGHGADVIWHAADVTGLGAIQGAAAAGIKAMGCFSDQTSLAPRNMATSFELNLKGAVETVAKWVAEGSFAGGREWKPTVDEMWLLKAGASGDHNPKLVSVGAWSGFQRIWRELAARKIVLPE
jgi:basic membrane protein A and related proteins